MYNCDLTKRSSGGVALLIEKPSEEFHADKVLVIRKQLRKGRYRVACRIDEVVETLLNLFGG